MTPDFLNQAMATLLVFFQAGFDRVFDPLHRFMGILLQIDIILFGLWIVMGRSGSMGAAFAKILYWGLIIHLLTFWPILVKTLAEGFIWLGLRAGGDTLTLGQFLNPAALIARGLQLSWPLINSLASFGLIAAPKSTVINFLLGIGLVVSTTIMAGRIFVAIVEHYLGMVVTAFMIPWGMLSGTAPFAQVSLGYVVSSGYRLGILAFVMSGVGGIVEMMAFTREPTWGQAISVLVVMLFLAVVVWCAPKIAMALLAGSPTLTGGDIFRTAAVAASATAGVLSGGTTAAIRTAGMAVTATTAAKTALTTGTGSGIARLPMSFASSSALAHRTRAYFQSAHHRGAAIGAHAADRAKPIGPPPGHAPSVTPPQWAQHWARNFRASGGPVSRIHPDL